MATSCRSYLRHSRKRPGPLEQAASSGKDTFSMYVLWNIIEVLVYNDDPDEYTYGNMYNLSQFISFDSYVGMYSKLDPR